MNILLVAPALFKCLASCSQPLLTLSQEVTEFLATSFAITQCGEELPLLGSVALTWYRQADSERCFCLSDYQFTDSFKINGLKTLAEFNNGSIY